MEEPQSVRLLIRILKTMPSIIRPESLSVVIPAYNEAGNLPCLVREIVSFLRHHMGSFEIILVDDGSQDDTPKILENLKNRFPEIKLIRHPVNYGYGASLKAGFSACRFDWIFFTDADRQFQIEDLLELFPHYQEASALVGYRKKRRDSFTRRFFSRGYNRIMRLLFGIRIRDINCAFKLIDSKMLKTMPIESRRFFVNTELLVKIQKRGGRILEIGVNHRPREQGISKVGLLEIPRTFQEMMLFCLKNA